MNYLDNKFLKGGRLAPTSVGQTPTKSGQNSQGLVLTHFFIESVVFRVLRGYFSMVIRLATRENGYEAQFTKKYKGGV